MPEHAVMRPCCGRYALTTGLERLVPAVSLPSDWYTMGRVRFEPARGDARRKRPGLAANPWPVERGAAKRERRCRG